MPLSISRWNVSWSSATSPTAPAPDVGHQREAPRVWNATELHTFLAAARHHRLYAALHLAAHTGMRRGEIVGLKWSDLDRSASRLSISRTLQNVGGRPVEFGVKTRTSRRTVDLDTHTIRELDRWRRQLRHEGLPNGRDDWMFCNRAGRFLNPESVSQLFGRIVARTDLARIRFHDLRHTHASLLVAAGVPIKVVSERLGHANIAFTMQTYQHVLPGMQADAALSTERLAKPTPPSASGTGERRGNGRRKSA